MLASTIKQIDSLSLAQAARQKLPAHCARETSSCSVRDVAPGPKATTALGKHGPLRQQRLQPARWWWWCVCVCNSKAIKRT